MNGKRLLVGLCLLSLSACGRDRIPVSDLMKVREGMTQEEVVKLLGPPISTTKEGKETILKYRVSEGAQGVVIEHGKATGISMSPVVLAGPSDFLRKRKLHDLGGAKDPVYVLANKRDFDFEVLGADVADRGKNLVWPPNKPPRSRVLPPGTSSRFVLGVVLDKRPPRDCSLELFNNTGKVACNCAQATTIDDASGRCTILWTGQGREQLPDGPYRAWIKTGDKIFLVVNWHTGEPPK